MQEEWPNRAFDPALTWAGALSIRLHKMTREEVQAAWTSAEALENRAVLKEHLPDVLHQLVGHICDQLGIKRAA